jgi:hypothetical protein
VIFAYAKKCTNYLKEKTMFRKFLFAVLITCVAPFAHVAHASTFGCTVLLCLANPASNGGPQGVAECVQPINQLYSDLLHGKPFPTCDLADGNDGSTYAKQVNTPFDPCPSPLTAVTTGATVVQGTPKPNVNKLTLNQPYGWVLSGTPMVSDGRTQLACVGTKVGSYLVMYSDPVDIYDTVVWQQPQSPRAIDVYINNAFYTRVHY